MSRRLILLIVAGALVLGAILMARSCSRAAVDAAPTSSAAPGSAPPDSATAAANAATESASAALGKQRGLAMYEAVSTLQNYLAAIGAQDWKKADPYWANGAPAPNGEADLRGLDKLRALRIENGNPKPLDSDPVPNALEIPVELRASIEGEAQRRYSGWYRLRRKVKDNSWEITSASVDVVPR